MIRDAVERRERADLDVMGREDINCVTRHSRAAQLTR
jgi:hypothetical protein